MRRRRISELIAYSRGHVFHRLFFPALFLGFFFSSDAQTVFTATGGNWNSSASWTKGTGSSTSAFPGQNAGQNDSAVIPTGKTITLIASQTTNSLTSVSVTGTLAVGAQSLTINKVTGSSGSLRGTGTVTVTTGTIVAGGAMSVSTLNCGTSAATLQLEGNWSVATFTGSSSSVTFDGTSQSINSTGAITFGNVQINSGATVTLAKAITVAGNWTCNQTSGLSAATFGVTFSGTSNTISGSGTTAFAGVTIGAGAVYTLSNTNTCTTLAFTSSGTASSLTVGSGGSLTTSGLVTINQPGAAVTTQLEVTGTGTATLNSLTFAGTATTTGYVSQVAVSSGSLTVSGAVTFANNATAANQVITVSTGSVTFSTAVTAASGTLSVTGSGSMSFNGAAPSLTFGGANAPVLSTVSGSTLNFAAGFTNKTNALTTLNSSSTQVFTGTGTITPSKAITFGNVQINSGATVTLAKAITVAGNWTCNQTSGLSAATFGVTFSGTSNTISGSGTTAFAGVTIGAGAVYTLSNTNTCTTLAFTSSGTASSLTVGSGGSLTTSGLVTINQPGAAVTTQLEVTGTGTATLNSLTFAGTATTTGYVSQVAVSSGSLTVSGAVTFANNATAANQVITVSTGSVTFSTAVTAASGTLSVTGSGSMSFNGAAPSLTFGGANAPVLSTVSGSTLNFAAGFTNKTNALTTLNSSSTQVFTGTGTITPTAAITFGNVQINSGATVTLAKAITVAGNWTCNQASGLSAATFGVTFSGTSNTISGSGTTAFAGVTIGAGAVYTLSNTNTCTTLAFTSSGTASSLTVGSGGSLTTSGLVTINQPGAAVTTQLEVTGTGTATLNSLTFAGTATTTGYVSQVAVSSGSLTVSGAVTFANNATAANQVITVSTGSVTFSTAVTAASGTLSVTGSGSMSFNGAAPSLTFGGANAPVLSTVSGSTLNFAAGFTNKTNALTTLNSSSTQVFTGTGTITPTAAITFGNVQINSGATVTPAGTISVTGNWTNNSGTFVEGTNLVQFNGSATQSIGGTGTTTFYNMNASGSAHTVQLTGTASLVNQIEVTNNATFNTNGQSFTLLSTKTLNGNTFTGGGTAQIGNLTNGTFTGSVNYQRYIDGKTDWRSLGWPISGQELSSWSSQLFTSGFSGSSDPGFSFVSVYYYNAVSQSYSAATSSSNAISANSLNGGGLLVFTGNTSPGTTMSPDITLLSAGTIISGAQTAGITSGVSGKYNLLANPYPAPLLFSSFYTANTNITNFYSVYDEAQGNYDTWDGMTGTSSGGRTSGTIANGQAFFVQATSGTTVTFQENQKASTADGNFLRTGADPYELMRLTLTGTGTPYYGSMLIVFSALCSDLYLVQEDALATSPFEPTAPSISSLSVDGRNLVVNKMSALTKNMDVPVKVVVGISGMYTITAPDLSMIDGSCITLEDKLTGTITDLNTTGSYSFTLSDTTTAARFVLHFSVPMSVSTSALNPTCPKSANGVLVANPSGTGPWTFSWTDSSGIVFSTATGYSADTLKNLSAGSYTVDVSASSGCADEFRQSFTLVNPPSPAASFMTPQTTVYTGDTLQFINTSENATMYSWSFGDGSNSGNYNCGHSYSSPGQDTVMLIVSDSGCDPDTAIKLITVLSATGIKAIQAKQPGIIISQLDNEVVVQLNPAESSAGVVSVYNLSGQLITDTSFLQTQNPVTLFFPDNIPQGIYLVRVATAYGQTVKKIILR